MGAARGTTPGSHRSCCPATPICSRLARCAWDMCSLSRSCCCLHPVELPVDTVTGNGVLLEEHLGDRLDLRLPWLEQFSDSCQRLLQDLLLCRAEDVVV